MESLEPSEVVSQVDPNKSFDLGPSLNGSFMSMEFKVPTREYYGQFSQDVEERFFIGSDGQVKATFTAFSRRLFQREKGEVKVLFVTNVRTANSRETLVGWSEQLLPEILKLKREMSCDYALFFLSRRERGLFNFFIRPRKKREDQIKFSHLRGVGIQIVQGQKFFADSPLEHIEIRTAREEDLNSLKGYIKQASQHMPLARFMEGESLVKDFESVKNFSLDDLALAFNAEGEIVGSMGAVEMTYHARFDFKFDEVLEPTFLALQTYLRGASWFTDLRPVVQSRSKHSGLQKVKFLTHMYFNNHDIFYSLICWWLKRTKMYPKVERPIFMYPYYSGDMKAAPHESLFTSGFKGDLYLMQEAQAPPSELLKPVLFSESLDIDLPLLI